MKKGNLSVQTQDIFPIIKRFLYTDHEIFLRELISNATDATRKISMIAQKGEYNEELGELKIQVDLDKKKKTITISDKGIGMTQEEVEKYINRIAFSSAEEFVKKYEQSENQNVIIGHFGLGFYSSFMVADKVEINTKSYISDEPAVKWSCEGNTEYKITKSEKKDRGTDVVLHISKDSEEFLDEIRLSQMLEKFCKFMPVEIQFGTEKVKEKVEGLKDKDGNDIEKEIEKPKIINNTAPIWTKQPTDLTDEDYKSFYQELYPFSTPPLFWIHLNVDYPFNLTGILYFPKVNNQFELQKNKIKLFCNQVYVTDTVDDIVPEFLTLLHGVIDSPDIPLNVSRSALQSDSNVKKISSYIVRKVSDKLQELFNKDRKEFENKWDDMSIFVKYGMLTDDKFYEKAEKFFLLKDLEDKYYTFDEYKELTKINQVDKDKSTIWLYASEKDSQWPYIDNAHKKGYNVLVFNEILDSHFIGLLERKLEKIQIKRIDSGSLDELINKDEKRESVLKKEDEESLVNIFKTAINNDSYWVKCEPLSPEDPAVTITQDEFSRRWKEMSKMNNMMGMGDLPDHYQFTINSNHPINSKLLSSDEESKNQMVKQLFDLARLSRNLLKGKDLADFVERSMKILE